MALKRNYVVTIPNDVFDSVEAFLVRIKEEAPYTSQRKSARMLLADFPLMKRSETKQMVITRDQYVLLNDISAVLGFELRVMGPRIIRE